MENVNKQLLDALKELASIVEIYSEANGNNFAWAELPFARKAIAAAKQAQQQQNNRECGCGWSGAVGDCVWLGSVGPLCPNCHETTEEAAQPPTVAVPDGWAKVAEALLSDYRYRDCSGSRTRDGRLFCSHCGEDCEDTDQHADDCPVLMARAMLAAAQKGGE